MEPSGFDECFNTVLNSIPPTDRTALHKFWAENPVIHPSTNIEIPAPLLLAAKDWSLRSKEEEDGVRSVAANANGNVLVFQEDFLRDAPLEAIQALIAYQLACVLLDIKDAPSEDGEEIVRTVEAWGYWYYDVDMWLAAKTSGSSTPTASFYAGRYIVAGRPPPVTADLLTVAACLFSGNRPDLAQKVLGLGN